MAIVVSKLLFIYRFLMFVRDWAASALALNERVSVLGFYGNKSQCLVMLIGGCF